ncbi:hypothetical protein ACIREO_35090 [Streptomyces sp. NPDC102441]|uniref:hypothetical protein n=1 Tax=Streptomyces sp. NPDC102441 TaxID=3366176 RepID=UPI00380221AE
MAVLLLSSLALPQNQTVGALPQNQTVDAVPVGRTVDAALLDCAIRTAPGDPVVMTPAVTTVSRKIHVRATMHLTDCRSSTSVGRLMRTGTVHIDAHVRANCSSVTPLDGQAAITWRDASGHRVGTSTVQARRRDVNSSISDGLLAGQVTRGLMSGAKVSGSITPTSSMSQCTDSGLRALAGSGRVNLHQ